MNVRARICGGDELATSAATLGLIHAGDAVADIAIVDLRQPTAIAKAAALPPELPRVTVIADEQRDLVFALGIPERTIASSCEPAVLGPLISAVLPAARRRATRSILITSVRGGAGRSLLTAHLARRLALTRSTLALDVSGGGGLSWWLGAASASWQDLEGLADELSREHLAVVANEAAPGLRIAGGPPRAPSATISGAALRAGLELCELVIIDGANLTEERTSVLGALVDRVLVLTYDDLVSLDVLGAIDLPADSWLIASQSTASSLAGHEVFRSLPRADREIADAATRRRLVGGPLGAAYDELAELLVIDTT